MTLIPFLKVRIWKTFFNTSTILVKTLSLLWRKKNGQLAFLDILLKRNKKKISALVYKKSEPTRTDGNQHCSSHHQTSCKEKVVCSLFNRTYSIITNEDDLTKENARIKQVLKGNGYQEIIISKIFKGIANNHSLSQPQQQA